MIGLESAKLSMARVAARVENGGHSVPHEKLARRYAACMANCKEALGFVEVGLVLENSSDLDEAPFQPMALTFKGRIQWQASELPDHIKGLLPVDLASSRTSTTKKRGKERGD